jgi:hypothetical protein
MRCIEKEVMTVFPDGRHAAAPALSRLPTLATAPTAMTGSE